MKIMKFKISEIFESIQGEGPHIGTPSLFIRFFGCNLRCPFCDTKYALTGNYFQMELEDLLDVVKRHNSVVLTGGEPLLQPIAEVIDKAKQVRFDIETNGTLEPYIAENVTVIMSPKVGYEVNEKILEDYSQYAYAKFVVNKENLQESLKYAKKYDWIEVYFQPMVQGTLYYTKEDWKLFKWLVKYFQFHQLPYRILPQLHKVVGVK